MFICALFYDIASMKSEDKPKQLIVIAKRVKELRIKSGYTSADKFAVAHDFERKQYWRLESGFDFKITTLLRLVRIHNITLDDFFREMN